MSKLSLSHSLAFRSHYLQSPTPAFIPSIPHQVYTAIVTMAPSLEEDLSTQAPNLAKGNGDANGSVPDPPMRYGKPLPQNWIPLYQKPSRTPNRRLRVITIGAGMSAMGFAWKIHHFHKLDGYMDHVIYEANSDIGGTWLVNTYPGVACDVPAHVYTFPFEPNPDWSKYYASGEEIQQYFKRTVAKYDLARNVKCGHRVERAEFDEEEGKWHVQIRHGDELINDSCDILVSATGFLNHWRWPSIEGLHSFKGHLVHSAEWNRDYDYSNKRIAVIGNGSSAIQIVPQLVEEAAHLTNFVRNATWITPGLSSAIIDGEINHTYTEDEKREFQDPDKLKAYRQRIQQGVNEGFAMFTKGSEAQKQAKESTAKMMLDRLGGDTSLAEKLTPDWEVGCRRTTPGPGYLEAFTRSNVSLVSESISCIKCNGIRTADGVLHEFDVIVCATGFDVSHRPPWPLIGRHGIELAEAWKEEPESYFSLAASGFPNYFQFCGSGSPTGHGSLTSQLQWSADWMCQWIIKIAEEDIKWIEPKKEVVEEYNAYSDEIMQTLVWSGGCRSWYKNHRVDGKVTALWAGSALTYKEMIDRIRPEDFEIRYRSRKNRFRFLGNGRSKLEYEPNADLAFYIYK